MNLDMQTQEKNELIAVNQILQQKITTIENAKDLQNTKHQSDIDNLKELFDVEKNALLRQIKELTSKTQQKKSTIVSLKPSSVTFTSAVEKITKKIKLNNNSQKVSVVLKATGLPHTKEKQCNWFLNKQCTKYPCLLKHLEGKCKFGVKCNKEYCHFIHPKFYN